MHVDAVTRGVFDEAKTRPERTRSDASRMARATLTRGAVALLAFEELLVELRRRNGFPPEATRARMLS